MDDPYSEAISMESAKLMLSEESFKLGLQRLLFQMDRKPSAPLALFAQARVSSISLLSCAALSSQSTTSTH